MYVSGRRIFVVTAWCVLVCVMTGLASAQTYYTRLNLTSNLSGKARHMDGLLRNPWGIAYGPGAPFWISDEYSGYSTLYDGQGNPQALQVVIPSGSGIGQGTPTGIVYNGSSEFQISGWTSIFLFASLDGTISGWSPFVLNSALVGAHTSGAVYTGLAITNRTSGNVLYAADAANNKVDMFDGNFNLTGSFTDTTIPAGFAPFGIRDISGQLYVTFASQTGGPGGFVDIFQEDGTFLKRFAHSSALNQPWGLAVAPSNFGPLSNTLLVSNNTKTGHINGFDLTTGTLVGTMKNVFGNQITIDGLWAIDFGGGTSANGDTNALYFTAGPNDVDGFFGRITTH